jgi:cold shock CspA family protein
VKAHETPPHGTISSLVPERDHGFISTSDGREIYFHRNSIADGKFGDLKVGQEVRFSEAAGDKSSEATSVRPVGKHHLT